ncbi:hypothetical protein Q2439_13440 [Escherichia coli]|nr:hypothetical protein [Escherichia coli]
MTDEIDRISEVVLNERQSVVKAWQTRTKEAPRSRGLCNDCGNVIPAAPCGAAGCGDLY